MGKKGKDRDGGSLWVCRHGKKIGQCCKNRACPFAEQQVRKAVVQCGLREDDLKLYKGISMS